MLRYTRPVYTTIQILMKPKKERTAAEQTHLQKVLATDQLYVEVLNKYGEEGARTFVRGLMLKGEGEALSRFQSIYWVYVLVGTITAHSVRYYAGESVILGELPLDICVVPGTILLTIDRDRMLKIEDNHQQAKLYGGIRQLKKVPFFSGMDNKELQALYSQCERQVYARNGCVIKEGQLATHLYVIISGTFVMRREVPVESDMSGMSGLLTTRSQSKKHRNIVLMTELDVFGEESMKVQIEADSEPVIKEAYVSQAICDSSEGVLLSLHISNLTKYPLRRYLSLPDKIYYFYQSRRQKAKNVFNEQRKKEKMRTEQDEQLQNYLEKLYRRPGKINLSYVHLKQTYNPEVTFYKKEELSSMKLKLKYQNVLDKVSQLKSLSQKTLRTPNFNKPKKVYKRQDNLETKVILREFNRSRQESASKGDNAITAMLIKSHSQILPDTNRKMTATPRRRQLLRTLPTDQITTPRNRRPAKSASRLRGESTSRPDATQLNFITIRHN